MENEIVEFYLRHFGGIDGFVASGVRQNLDPEHIRVAAVKVYEIHHNGRGYRKRIVMGQQILAHARKLKIAQARTERERFESIEHEISQLQRGFWKKIGDLLNGYDTAYQGGLYW